MAADTVTDTKTTFQRENLVTEVRGIFPITKGPLKLNLQPNFKYFQIILKIWVYFQIFKNSYPQEEHEKNLRLNVLVSEKKIDSNTVPKLELGFGS